MNSYVADNREQVLSAVRRGWATRHARPLETARMMLRAREWFGLSQAELSRQIGVSYQEVSRYESLVTELAGPVKRFLEEGYISYRVARDLTAIPKPAQREIAIAVVKRRIRAGTLPDMARSFEQVPGMTADVAITKFGNGAPESRQAGVTCISCGGSIFPVLTEEAIDKKCIQCGRRAEHGQEATN